MFVQVFHGRVTDSQQVRQLLDDWAERLAPGAQGWLGSTSGVTADGTFVGVARFDSPDAARRNSGRAMQGEWWSRMSKLFEGEVEFHDCSEVDVFRGGGADDAGFVQVIQGRAGDTARLRELTRESEGRLAGVRPDLLGVVAAYHDGEDGAFTHVVYFTTEEDARATESAQPPEVAEMLRRRSELMREVRYLDLREPWMHSPT